jgi:GNAT superfamily N-acetyltransferase
MQFMQPEISLRQLIPSDGEAYAALVANSPDTGRISTAQHYNLDAYQALKAIHGNFTGVVAEHSGFQGFVGAGLIRFGECQYEGEIRPYAFLNTLVVHPDFRRRGIASQLAKWRLEYARNKIGPDGIIWAIIQRGNIGSELTARKWQGQFLQDRILLIPLRPRMNPPQIIRDYRISALPTNQSHRVSGQLNNFYQSFNMFTPRSKIELEGWSVASPFNESFRHFLIVLNANDEKVAGLVLTETYKLRYLQIVKAPFMARMANRILHVVPSDYIMREINLSHIWFAQGQIKAARYLLETVRWEWRNKASSFIIWIDPICPFIDLFNLRPWTLKTETSIVLQSKIKMSEDKPVYYE